MLPDIPDNDGGRCWAGGCQEHGGYANGLCPMHNSSVVNMVKRGGRLNGRLFDHLGLRLNVLEETGGKCIRAPGPCDLRLCRFHADDATVSIQTKEPDLAEPCAIRLAMEGPRTLEEIAQMQGCTRERIRQLEHSALRRLRRAIEREDAAAGRKRRAA